MSKQIWSPIDARNFGCDVSKHANSGGARVPHGTRPGGGGRMPSFLGGQPAFFLAANRMTTVALKNRGFFES